VSGGGAFILQLILKNEAVDCTGQLQRSAAFLKLWSSGSALVVLLD